MSRHLTQARGAGRRRATVRRRRGHARALVALVLAVLLVAGAALAVALLGGAGGRDAPTAGTPTGDRTRPVDSSSRDSSTSSDSSASSATEREEVPEPPRPPELRECYALDLEEAVAAVSDVPPTSCEAPHTARTYAVGELPTLVDGHLLAVDSTRARRAPARECPQRLGDFLGGDRDALRLSMFRPVWFSPSVAQSDRGANWYRCDVVAVAGDGELAPLTGPLEGVLGRSAGSQTYGMCGTAEPGTDAFERVACARPHAWRAVEVIELGGSDDYPGVESVRVAGQAPCEDVGRELADDPLSFRWGYEWPTREQWRSGVTWGLCWVPDAS